MRDLTPSFDAQDLPPSFDAQDLPLRLARKTRSFACDSFSLHHQAPAEPANLYLR
jgi:hypothetical protein